MTPEIAWYFFVRYDFIKRVAKWKTRIEFGTGGIINRKKYSIYGALRFHKTCKTKRSRFSFLNFEETNPFKQQQQQHTKSNQSFRFFSEQLTSVISSSISWSWGISASSSSSLGCWSKSSVLAVVVVGESEDVSASVSIFSVASPPNSAKIALASSRVTCADVVLEEDNVNHEMH